MSLVHPSGPAHDWSSLVGLAVVVFGIIALAVPCLKLAVDQLFALF